MQKQIREAGGTALTERSASGEPDRRSVVFDSAEAKTPLVPSLQAFYAVPVPVELHSADREALDGHFGQIPISAGAPP